MVFLLMSLVKDRLKNKKKGTVEFLRIYFRLLNFICCFQIPFHFYLVEYAHCTFSHCVYVYVLRILVGIRQNISLKAI